MRQILALKDEFERWYVANHATRRVDICYIEAKVASYLKKPQNSSLVRRVSQEIYCSWFNRSDGREEF